LSKKIIQIQPKNPRKSFFPSRQQSRNVEEKFSVRFPFKVLPSICAHCLKLLTPRLKIIILAHHWLQHNSAVKKKSKVYPDIVVEMLIDMFCLILMNVLAIDRKRGERERKVTEPYRQANFRSSLFSASISTGFCLFRCTFAVKIFGIFFPSPCGHFFRHN
jgi:hypothetical protein